MGRQGMFRNPWWVVVGSTLALVVGNGPVVLFTFGVFLKPVSSAFGWDRGTMSLAVGLSMILSGLATPIAGKLVDRWGVRRVTLAVIVLFSLSTATIALTPPSALAFVLLYACWGFISGGQAPLPYAKAISAWFDGRRGLALGIAMAGIGIGTALLPQLVRLMIVTVGWRGAYVGLGAVTFAIAFPAVALFVREPDRHGAARLARPFPGGAASPATLPGVEVRDAFGSYAFWFMGIAMFLAVTAMNGTIAHVVPLLTDRGISPTVAASMLAAVGMSTLVGRLLSGYLLDRFFAPYVAAGFFFLPCIGIILLSVNATAPIAVLGVVCLGLSLGAEVDLIGFLVTRYFGLHRFGEIYGYLFAVFTIGSGVGPYLMGWCFDATHSYNLALTGFGIALVVGSLIISRLGPYVYPVARRSAPTELESVAGSAD